MFSVKIRKFSAKEICLTIYKAGLEPRLEATRGLEFDNFWVRTTDYGLELGPEPDPYSELE